MANGLFGGGNGTWDNPYLVEDADDLNAIREDLSAHYIQTADISLTAFPEWQKIGTNTAGNRFSGSYDGAGYKISNLRIRDYSSSPRAGLFCFIEGAVKNVHLREVDIDCSVLRGAKIVHRLRMRGGIYGGTFRIGFDSTDQTEDLNFDVSDTELKAALEKLEGITGEVAVESQGTAFDYTWTISYADAAGEQGLIVTDNSLIAQFPPAELEITTEVVSDSYDDPNRYAGVRVAALAGACSGTVRDCSVQGGTIKGSYIVGGLLATCSGTVERCWTNVTVSANYVTTNWQYGPCPPYCYWRITDRSAVHVGGLVGIALSGCNISNCYSMGMVESTFMPPDTESDSLHRNMRCVGGFSGAILGGLVQNCYSIGKVISAYAMTRGFSGNDADRCNQVPGEATTPSQSIVSCYYDAAQSEQDDDDGWGDPRATTQMTYPYDESTTYIDWDFETVWDIQPEVNGGYPMFLQPWIPVVDGDELNNIRYAEVNVFGKGTAYEGAYLGGLDKHYRQLLDIDLSDFANWEPIGSSNVDQGFVGVYDGNGHQISNLTVNRGLHVGLFGWVLSPAVLKNIYLVNVDVYGGWDGEGEESQFHGRRVGGLAGYSSGQIEGCSVASGRVEGKYEVGGLVGNTGGGIIKRCWTNVYCLGYGSAMNVYYWGDGSVTYNRTWCDVGGLAGYSTSQVENCYARGEVRGTLSEQHVPNIAGFIGRVSGSTGYTKNCYSTGFVSSARSYAGDGGFIRQVQNTAHIIENCYYDMETSGKDRDEGKGEPRTTAQMTEPVDFSTTYITWDFDGIWSVDGALNDGYPVILTLAPSPEPGELVGLIGGMHARSNLYIYSADPLLVDLVGVVDAHSQARANSRVLVGLVGDMEGKTHWHGTCYVVVGLDGCIHASSYMSANNLAPLVVFSGHLSVTSNLLSRNIMQMWAKRNGVYQPVQGYVKNNGVYRPVLTVFRKFNGVYRE